MPRKRQIHTKQKTARNRRRLPIILIIAAGALLIAAALIIPSLRPVGDIVVPAEHPRPNAQANQMGNPDAPVKVEIYADFQCPGCARFSRTFEKELITNYVETGKIKLEYHAWAFIDDRSIEKESKHAAEAAYCAMDQNKFWEYHDILYANQTGENIGNFTKPRLLAFAEKLGLDMGEFKQCYNSGKYTARVLQERQTGNELGVHSTPSFVVNGTLIVPEKTYAELTIPIDAELAKIGQ